MQSGEINSILIHLDSLQLKMDKAAGAALSVELRMRLLAELSQPMRSELKKNKYWNTELKFLVRAINVAFNDELELADKQKIDNFVKSRNNLLHGDFVGFAKSQDTSLTGRQILSSSKRNILVAQNIKESIVSVDWNQVFPKFRKLAKDAEYVINKLLRSLAANS